MGNQLKSRVSPKNSTYFFVKYRIACLVDDIINGGRKSFNSVVAMKLEYAIDLRATPQKVWDWIGNSQKAMMWQTNVTKGEILEQTPNMIGTTFRETIEEDGGSTEMKGVITDYKENKVLAMHLDGKYNMVDVEWHVEDIGKVTRLTAYFDIRFKSVVKILSIINRPIFKKKIMDQLQVEFARLRELCECDD